MNTNYGGKRAGAGRHNLEPGTESKRIQITMSQTMYEWLLSQDGTLSNYVRNLIQKDIERIQSETK